MSEPTIIYQSSEMQYWYDETGRMQCQYIPDLWRDGYSSETFAASQLETELVKTLTLATKRAEAAEARRREIDDEAFAYAEQIEVLKAECEALRQDAERLDAIESGEVHIECMGMTLRHMNVYSKHGKCVTSGLFGTQLSLTLRQAIDAALAVQPTTGDGA